MSKVAPAVVPYSRRVPWVATTAWAAALAIGSGGGREPQAWLAAAIALAVALDASRRSAGVARTVGWGVAMVVASMAAESGSRASDACGAIGAFACVCGAVVAVARMPSQGGMVPAERRSPAALVALLGAAWGVAVAACLAPERRPTAWMVDHSRAWAWLAMVVSAALLGASSQQTLRRRRWELAIAARATAARSLLVTVAVAAVTIALFGPLRADVVARAALALGGACVTATALHADATRVARTARRAVTLAVTGGGLVLVAATATSGRMDAWLVTWIAVSAALAVGSAAALFEAPLLPAGGAWLRAFGRASEAATRAEPDDAIRETLLALRAPMGLDLPSPELWTFLPTRLTTVDAAGYLHEREAEIPDELARVAASEPEATVRADVLEALEVRRPHLRPLRAWMVARGALLATRVAADGETEGLLVLPAGQRAEPVTLEEVQGAKRVADDLAKACRARGAASRLLARARRSDLRADAAEEAVLCLRHDRIVEAGRHALAATRLARPATVGIYAAASRMALEALERRTSLGAPIVVVGPSGVDPVPYLARAHLSGARATGPLVLVDGASMREQDLARWRDQRVSPLALADGGMLVILDGAALAHDVQELVARACAERRAPWDGPQRLDVQLALTGVGSTVEPLREGYLEASLAARLRDAYETPIILPRLQDRPEDFRAILTDRLGREGLRVLGRPVGIEPAAYACLAEHEFPGDDVELSAVVQSLVASCENETVRLADVSRLGSLGWIRRPEVRDAHDPRPNRKKNPLLA